MNFISRIPKVLSLLAHDRQEFSDRVNCFVDHFVIEPILSHKPKLNTIDWLQLLRTLSEFYDTDANAVLAEPELLRISREIEERLGHVRHSSPLSALGLDGGTCFAKCCYLLCRLAKPNSVIETGVAHGITSAHIRMAMDVNQKGTLNSIDLPLRDPGAKDLVGLAIPERLRTRWTLHKGRSRRLLPQLVRDLGSLDMFVHDSDHSFWNMRREFNTVLPIMKRGTVVVSDDAQGNQAFEALRKRMPQHLSMVAEMEKEWAWFGIAIK